MTRVSSKALEKKAKDRRAKAKSDFNPALNMGKSWENVGKSPTNGKLLGTFSINGGLVSKLSLIIEG